MVDDFGKEVVSNVSSNHYYIILEIPPCKENPRK